MRKLAIVLAVWLVIAAGIGAFGCAEKASPTPEPTIPSNFTTYIDENELFSISYPQDWEIPLSKLEEMKQATIELLNSMNLNIPLDVMCYLFTAGQLTEGGADPNLKITAYTLPADWPSLDAQVEGNIRGVEANVKDFHQFSRVKTTVGGKEAEIIEMLGSVEGTTNGITVKVDVHMLQMYIISGGNVWIVQCLTLAEKYGGFENTFHAILRSFRVYK
jgi:hypothetical protein